jgi:hypothetical protein
MRTLMWPLRQIAWLVWDAEWIPLGPLAPWVLAVGLWAWPNRVKPARGGASEPQM